MIELKRESTIKTFDQVLIAFKPGTRRGYTRMFKNFEKFCQGEGGNMEEMVRKLSKEDELMVGDVLQKWINFNNALAPSTVRVWSSYLKTYLIYRNVNYPKTRLKLRALIKEEKYGLSLDDIQKILNVAGNDMRVRIMTQLTSGMRRGEMHKLKRKDFHIGKRIMIKIPAIIAKFNKGRTTFVSSEVSSLLINRLSKLKPNDLVFGNENILEENIGDSYEQNLTRYLKKTGLDFRYDSTNYHQINTHSFRAYFITKISRRDPNLAKKWAGQEVYMGQYDRLSDEEKLELYIKFESDLFIFKAKPESDEIQDLRKRIDKFEAKQAEEDRIDREADELDMKDPEIGRKIKDLINQQVENILEKENKTHQK